MEKTKATSPPPTAPTEATTDVTTTTTTIVLDHSPAWDNEKGYDIESILAVNSKAALFMKGMHFHTAALVLSRAITDLERYVRINADTTTTTTTGMEHGDKDASVGDDFDMSIDDSVFSTNASLPPNVTISSVPIPTPSANASGIHNQQQQQQQNQDDCMGVFVPYCRAMIVKWKGSHSNCSNSKSSTECNKLFQTESCRSLLAGILFFNLGLALQMCAESSSLASAWCQKLKYEGLWSRSLVSYQAALGLMGYNSSSWSEEPAVVLLEMALLNNIAYIYQVILFDAVAADGCLDQMRLILDEVTEFGDTFIPQGLSTFYLNTRYNVNVRFRPAPAA